MAKHIHEIRDAVHVFVRLDSHERKVLDSRPFQRLRHIHQLALTSLVYPGATHKRFEHSLGVMELAGRVYQIITTSANRDDRVKDVFPGGDDQIAYWRRALRMAALCHDIGHLPFSHAAEKELLPDEYSHEKMTVDLIMSNEMKEIWNGMIPLLDPNHIAKLAVGPKKLPDQEFSKWERILSEIIVGDSFGVDRMDYLLRDSLHTGVVYGKFDQYRLIDTLRILPENDVENDEPVLGTDAGGMESAEAVLLARYFMYSQVYFHPVRRAYDIHLKEFMVSWLGENGIPIEPPEFLKLTDNEVLSEIANASTDKTHAGHDSAKRIVNRGHYRVLYKRNPNDAKKNPEAGTLIFNAASEKFGLESVRHDRYIQKQSGTVFPIKSHDGRIVSSLEASDVLKNVPLVNIEYVFVNPEIQATNLL